VFLCGPCLDCIGRPNLETGSQSGVAVAKTRGQFGNLVEGKRPPLETVTRRLMKAVTEDINVCVTLICKV
jgi:hypothetical protein